MIGTLLKISFINLRRDRVVQAMSFLLPVIFFSIFALVFGQQRDPTTRINVVLVDEDHSATSRQLAMAFVAEGALAVRTTADRAGKGATLDRAAAEKLVRDGDVPVAVIFVRRNGQLSVQLLADVSDPIAPQVVSGLLQKVGFTARMGRSAAQGTPVMPAMGLPIEMVNVLQPAGRSNSPVSFYAAGVGVMFLLFSSSGGGGALLDEEESGTLGRLLGSRLGMRGVLVGKWMFLAIMGMLQLTLMFTWGQVAFGLPLTSHLPGFIVMTVFTAMAAAGFGILLATIARSRQQLSGISTIVILTMSALGGSMFPRFFMSETMQKLGLVTFNAWALDGYIKVFWRSAPLADLWPQVLVLSTLTVIFMVLARMFARRWETL